MNDPFEIVFNAYMQEYPKTTLKKSWKKMSKSQRVIFILLVLTAIPYLGAAIRGNFGLLTSTMLLLFVESGVFKFLKKKKQKKYDETINQYKTEVIQPLRNKLKQYQLYDSESISFLRNWCEKELTRETEIEAFIRRVKSFFLFWGKVIGIAVAWTFFRFLDTNFAEDAINIQEIAPSELLIEFLNLFALNEAVAVIFVLSIIIFGVGILIGVAKMCFEDGINSRRKKIRQFANALDFLLVDVKREELAEDEKKLPPKQSQEKKSPKRGK